MLEGTLVLHKVGQESVQAARLGEERWYINFASSGFLGEDPQMLGLSLSLSLSLSL